VSRRCNKLGAMLIYSMSVSVDGFIADREGAFGWTVPSEELFRFHISQVRELGGHVCGRKLYETMLVWETDPSLRDSAAVPVWPRRRSSSASSASCACSAFRSSSVAARRSCRRSPNTSRWT
jgi:dihydrofolate reductase